MFSCTACVCVRLRWFVCVQVGDRGTNLFAQVTPRPLCRAAFTAALPPLACHQQRHLLCLSELQPGRHEAHPLFFNHSSKRREKPKAGSLRVPCLIRTQLSGDVAAELFPGVTSSTGRSVVLQGSLELRVSSALSEDPVLHVCFYHH